VDRTRPCRVEGPQPPAQPQVRRRQLGDDVAQHLFEHVLRHLLPALGRVTVVREAEHSGEPGDLLAQEGRAEGDIL
jgi:hypothetical protein